MTVVYASSMDQYGLAAGDTFGGNTAGGAGSAAGWTLDPDLLLGDAWSSMPTYQSKGGTSRDNPVGTYDIAVPSFGAREGDYALVANSPNIKAFEINGYQNFTYPDLAGVNLAIPGTSQAVRILHFAFAIDALPVTAVAFGGLIDFANSGGDTRARLKVDPSGRLVLYDGSTMTWAPNVMPVASPTTLLTTASPVISPNTWYSISIVITENGDTGDTVNFELWIGNIEAGNKVMDGANLEFSATGNIDILSFLPISMGSDELTADTTTRAVRDIVIANNSGSYNNSALGQVFVSAQEMRSPDAGGGWVAQPRANFSTGILDSVTTATGVRLADTPALDIGTQDFTLETFLRFNSIPDASTAEEMDIISRWRTDTGERSYRLYYDGSSGSLKFDVSTDGTTVTTLKDIPWDAEKWKWYHVAISRWTDTTGTFLSLFVDGVELGIATASTHNLHAAAAALGVAAKFNGTSTLDTATPFDGWMDETRVTIGTARYSAPFSPPTTIFGRNDIADTSFADVVLLLGYDGEIADEGPDVRTIAVAGSNPLTYTEPGDTDYTYSVLNQRPAWDDTYVEATNYFAQSILTLTAQPSDGETVTIGTQTYTFVTAFDTVEEDQVLIGSDVADTLSNFTAAVNGGTGEGVDYGTGTAANTDAVAVTYASPQLIIRALTAGASTVATTDTLGNGYFDGTTLSGGTDIPDDSDFQVERLPIDATGVLAVQVTARASKTDAGSATARFDLIGPSAGVAAGTAFNPDLAPGWQRQVFEEDPDTTASLTPSTILGGRIRFKRVT